MITKKLVHDIITFCNNYIDNKNIVFKVAKFPEYIYISIDVCDLCKNNSIDCCIGTINNCIQNKEEFIKYKQKVLEELPKLLEQLNKK